MRWRILRAVSPIDLSRDHPDPLDGQLPPLVIDRRRVVHSAAFRRLQHKTQVFVARESDHFRTRLTHTLEVAHLARTLAARHGLNADLAEVAALAHDLGHPPFGHAGEKALDECLRDHGGFEHNRHTLRIVEELEHPYPQFRGLNLTRAVRACLAQHRTPYDAGGAGAAPAAPVESQIVDLADRVAYALHDLQDGLYADLIDPCLLASVALWRDSFRGPAGSSPDVWRGQLRPTVDRIELRLVQGVNVVQASGAAASVTLAADAERELVQLEQFLLAHVYLSEALRRADEHARRIISAVFDAYCAHPERLPPRFVRRLVTDGTPRVVTNYVAGMTDRYCVGELARIADTSEHT